MKSTEMTPKQAVLSQVEELKNTKVNAPRKEESFWERLEFYRVAIIVGTLAAVGCLGGIMALYAFTMPIMVLIIGVCFSMIALSTVIGMAPVRWILPAAVVAVLVDIVIIISGLVG